MAINYTPLTDFLTKDTLPKEDPDKVILGADFDAEFNAISTAFAGAAPTNNPTFTGTATFDGVTVNTVTINGLVTAGSLDIGGNATVAGTLGVTGAATFGGNATFGGDLDVTGTLTANGSQVPTFEDVQNIVSGAELGPISELDNLSNVDETGKVDGDFLVWDNDAGNWVPKTEEALDLSALTTDVRTTAAIKAGSYEETLATTVGLLGSSSYDYPAFTASGNVVNYTANAGSIMWNGDGTRIFLQDHNGSDSHRTFSVSPPYSLGSASLISGITSQNLGFQYQNAHLAFSSDGSYLYGLDQGTNAFVTRLELTTPFVLAAGNVESQSFKTFTSGGYGSEIHLSSDDMNIYVLDDDQTINQYALPSANEIATASSTPTKTLTISGITAFTFIKNGKAMLVTLNSGNIEEHKLAIAWDISTYNTTASVTIAAGLGGSLLALGASPDGKRLVVGNASSATEYNMSQATIDFTFDCSSANTFESTLSATGQVVFSNVPSSGTVYACSAVFQQDATGGHAIVWPSSVVWAGGEAPTLSADAGAKDVFVFMTSDGGTTWYGFTSGRAFA